MPRSMTGFGRAQRETPQGRLIAEIRAVNARFNETRVRLPSDAMELELSLRSRIKAALARGKIDCTVTLEPRPDAPTLTVNAEALRSTFEQLRQAVAGLDLAGGVTLEALLRATPREDLTRGVWREESFQSEVEAVVVEALTALDSARATEGEKTAAVLADHLTQIEQAIDRVRETAPLVVEAAGNRLRLRIEELERSQGLEADSGRLEQELVYFAQRLDIAEELDRLAVHCAAFREVLAADEPVGRRMDFLLQEIGREINTVGSKAKDAGVTGQVVDLKVVAEQMREQVQNVE